MSSQKPWFFTPDHVDTDKIPKPFLFLKEAFDKIVFNRTPNGCPRHPLQSSHSVPPIQVVVASKEEITCGSIVLDQNPFISPDCICLKKDKNGVLVIDINQNQYQICDGCNGYTCYNPSATKDINKCATVDLNSDSDSGSDSGSDSDSESRSSSKSESHSEVNVAVVCKNKKQKASTEKKHKIAIITANRAIPNEIKRKIVDSLLSGDVNINKILRAHIKAEKAACKTSSPKKNVVRGKVFDICECGCGCSKKLTSTYRKSAREQLASGATSSSSSSSSSSSLSKDKKVLMKLLRKKAVCLLCMEKCRRKNKIENAFDQKKV
jgi:hypothetical protein